MIRLLAKYFVKDYKNYANPATRRGYGTLCGIMGICLNLLQSIAKFVVGWLAGTRMRTTPSATAGASTWRASSSRSWSWSSAWRS